MRNRIHMRAARRAVEISGCLQALGGYLATSPLVIAGWTEGLEDVPPDVLVKLLDIILGQENLHLPAAMSISVTENFKHRHAANS